MFTKEYQIKDEHLDFQGVVDGLYYPFYMEWCRHAFMKECAKLDLEEEFKKGHIHTLLEYSIKFKKSLKKGDLINVTCSTQKADKKNRINFFQQILVDNIVYAEAIFTATCIINGRPTVPDEVLNTINQ
ncbi:acyl-CoA thioesterase [Arsenophonus sp.]|uniref:acyl-CoA thioesterase n=1 Tax=Arsenophonus sp. TaxID=1872640 RepID=UPI00286131C3|nr:acyl-CoA thioesterase [Arsenophonus sp.]MDR5615042.1 acyl-CoA thioesterase [Arsenophonus sp.]